MSYDRDYILRMVREFASFLARIVRSKDGACDERTVADLDHAARTFVGLGLEALDALPTDQLTMMLSLGGTLDVNRAYTAGRLLEERATLAADGGNPEAAAGGARKALHLLADAVLAFGSYLNEEHRASLHRLTERLLTDPVAPLGEAPPLLGKVLDVHLRHDEEVRIRRIARVLAEASGEREEPMRALRIALRGRAPALLGRLQPVVGEAELQRSEP